jgi:hypothetical protein
VTTTAHQLTVADRAMISDFVALTTAVDVGDLDTPPDVLAEMFHNLDPEMAGLIVVMARELLRTGCRLVELEQIMNGRLLS